VSLLNRNGLALPEVRNKIIGLTKQPTERAETSEPRDMLWEIEALKSVIDQLRDSDLRPHTRDALADRAQFGLENLAKYFRQR
jgi:hypothetical protein